MAGVDSTGFTPKTVTEIITDLQTGYRGVYGAAVNVAARSRIGQRIALFAGALSEVWELGQVLFNGLDPTAATGSSLDNQLKLVGLARKPETFSRVLLTLTGADGTIVGTGKRAAVGSTSVKFATITPALLTLVADWAQSTNYPTPGVRRKANGNVYQVITPGVSSAVGTGPSGTDADITDGTVHWAFLGAGEAAQDVTADAIISGPVNGYARTIDTIDTPVSGWQGVINVLDAQTGQAREEDPDARARRDRSFSKQGSTPLDAIRTAVLAVAGVTSCTIFENFSDDTVDGMPQHSFEALVEGGADQEIINAIFSTRPGGIRPYGNTSGSATDSQGGSHVVAFSRPVAVDIYVQVTLSYDPAYYPANGDDQVADELVDRQNGNPVGKNVVASGIAAGLFIDVPGILDVSEVLIGTVNPPVSSATVDISPRQKAAFDTSRITVVSSPGSF